MRVMTRRALSIRPYLADASLALAVASASDRLNYAAGWSTLTPG
jgi:hypothetical protein